MDPLTDGDVVTIAGVYDDGTFARNEGPYDEKPLMMMRVMVTKDGSVWFRRLEGDGPQPLSRGRMPKGSES